MDKQTAQRNNLNQLQRLADNHGPEILDRVRALILERAETFQDPERAVVWIINVSNDGRDITVDVRP